MQIMWALVSPRSFSNARTNKKKITHQHTHTRTNWRRPNNAHTHTSKTKSTTATTATTVMTVTTAEWQHSDRMTAGEVKRNTWVIRMKRVDLILATSTNRFLIFDPFPVTFEYIWCFFFFASLRSRLAVSLAPKIFPILNHQSKWIWQKTTSNFSWHSFTLDRTHKKKINTNER